MSVDKLEILRTMPAAAEAPRAEQPEIRLHGAIVTSTGIYPDGTVAVVGDTIRQIHLKARRFAPQPPGRGAKRRFSGLQAIRWSGRSAQGSFTREGHFPESVTGVGVPSTSTVSV